VSETYDRRITAARPDLAAAHLKGVITAERYREGRIKQVAQAAIGLRSAPSSDATLETELLFGEIFTVYELKGGWVWGQAALDSHVGYAPADAFSDAAMAPTHRVTARATPLLTAADVKLPSRMTLPMNAKLHVVEQASASAVADGATSFPATPLRLGQPSRTGSPSPRVLSRAYLWAARPSRHRLLRTDPGRARAAGIAAPRDTDLMETARRPIALDAELKRAIVFWKGHMGAMLDGTRLIHANAYAMQVAIEDFAPARTRIAAEGLPVRTVKRL
jgi:hypothetical protein